MWKAAGLATIALAAASAAAEPRRFRDRPFAPEMTVIPAGAAILGSPEAETVREGRAPALAAFERPQRRVAFPKPFGMATHHVTRAEFAAFARATGRPMAGCVVLAGGKWSEGPDPAYGWNKPGWPQRGDEPVTCVNWDDAAAYARWLSARTGAAYRLPSEAEWEYAARAGTATARWWGDGATGMCARANGGDRDYAAVLPADTTANLTCSDGYAFTSPVSRYPANPYGLHDMYGNAWQWTADCFAPVPGTAPPGDCKARSIRGGSWHSSVATLRSATRFSLPPALRSSSLGFRVMREMR
jgi:formylglycine-generating enzyme required for sulfatase activity